MKKIIAFSNQKGGVGKTTTCVNFAANLAELGNQVLLIDFDPQGNASSGLGIVKSNVILSAYDVLINHVTIKQALMPVKCQKNLSILPSSINLAGAELELINIISRESVLKKALYAVQNQFDYVLIDCPPSLGLITVNALTASDSVIIPIQSEFFALEGLTQLMNSIKLVKNHLNPPLVIEGVVLTMFDSRSIMSTQIRDEISKYFGEKLFKTLIPRNIRLSEAPSHGLPIHLYDRKCNGAKAYAELVREFLAKQK